MMRNNKKVCVTSQSCWINTFVINPPIKRKTQTWYLSIQRKHFKLLHLNLPYKRKGPSLMISLRKIVCESWGRRLFKRLNQRRRNQYKLWRLTKKKIFLMMNPKIYLKCSNFHNKFEIAKFKRNTQGPHKNKSFKFNKK